MSAYALNAFHIHYQTHRFKFHYSTLFSAVWDIFVQLLIAIFFTGICWIILLICNSLFKWIGIYFIENLLAKSWFFIWISAVFVTGGLWIATQGQLILHNIRHIVILMCRYLLIPLAMISIFFVVALAFKGLQQYSTFSPIVFLAIAFISILFLNGLYQDGLKEKPYPTLLFWICRIFFWITPIFTLIALYDTYFIDTNSIAQKGFNTHNFSYFITILITLAYNLCYAIITLSSKKPLFHAIQKTNIVLGILLITVTTIAYNRFVMHYIPNYQRHRTLTTFIKPHRAHFSNLKLFDMMYIA